MIGRVTSIKAEDEYKKKRGRKYNCPLNGACQPGELKQKPHFESMSSNKVEWQIPVI